MEVKKAASHPDVKRPSNVELIELAGQVIDAIERCGASTELTNAVCLAADLQTYLRKPASLQPHQIRVIGEKMELDAKIAALRNFIATPTIMTLPEDERNRLTSQLSCMDGYSSILGQRIAAF